MMQFYEIMAEFEKEYSQFNIDFSLNRAICVNIFYNQMLYHLKYIINVNIRSISAKSEASEGYFRFRTPP